MNIHTLFLAYLATAGCGLPDDMPAIIGRAIRLRHGGALVKMSDIASLNVEQGLKKVVGMDPKLDFNMTMVRGLPDAELYRLLVLAAVGNFTSSASDPWQQDCRVVWDAETGYFLSQRQNEENTMALKVLVVILCALQAKRYIAEKWAK